MKYTLIGILFLCFCLAGTAQSYANQKTKEPRKIHDISKIDIEKELKTIFKAKVLDFFPVKDSYPEFFEEVKKQIPLNAELLEVYLPTKDRQEIERGHYDNVLNIVYFYRMPQILHANIPLQKLQYSFVCEGLEAVYESYKVIEPPTLQDKKAWEEKMYEQYLAGKSVYVKYKKVLGALDTKYTILFNLPLSDEHNMAFFMSHYPFINNGQIYFLSSSALLTDNNYYQTMRWTRRSLDDFIERIPLEYYPSNEEE